MSRGDTGPRFAAANTDCVPDLLAACDLQEVASDSVSLRVRTEPGKHIIGEPLTPT